TPAHADRQGASGARRRRVRIVPPRRRASGDVRSRLRAGVRARAGPAAPHVRRRDRQLSDRTIARKSPMNRRVGMAAVLIALASALFFTATYVLNRAMANAGEHWAWSATLRYLLTLPMLALVLPWRGGFAPVLRAIRAQPRAWLVWSGIGFTLFCLCLTWAAA